MMYDDAIDAVYIQLFSDEDTWKHPIDHSIEVTDDVIFDVDEYGNIVGIDIQNYSEVMGL